MSRASVRWPAILPVLATTLLLAGCTQGGGDVASAYSDANERFANEFEGGLERDHGFTVPEGTASLRVALAYDVTGGLSAELLDPAGNSMRSIEMGGTERTREPSWYKTADPMAGEWRVEVEAGGRGAYAVGAYF